MNIEQGHQCHKCHLFCETGTVEVLAVKQMSKLMCQNEAPLPEFVGDTSLGWTRWIFFWQHRHFCKPGHFFWTSEHSNCKCFNEDLSSAIEEVWPSCNFFWRILVSSHSEPKCCRTLNLSVTTFWIQVSHSSLSCARHLLWHLVCDILATSRVRHSGFRVSRLATINCVTLFIFVLVCFV